MAGQVHVIVGSTGEYSDRTEWFVVAYGDPEAAKAHVLRLDEWMRENRVHSDGYSILGGPEGRYGLKCPDDPNFHADYTGTSYYVAAVDLAD